VDRLLAGDIVEACRRLFDRPWWQPTHGMPTPTPADLVDFLAPALVGQLGYDGTRGHNRTRQDGFWIRTPEGWSPTEISEVVALLDSSLRVARDELHEARVRLPEEAHAAYEAAMSADVINPEAVKSANRTNAALPEQLADVGLRISLITTIREALKRGGPYRGQLVAALRDSHKFDMSKADVLELVGRYLDVTGPSGRALLAGFARSALAV
jgi:hypothetical protein